MDNKNNRTQNIIRHNKILNINEKLFTKKTGKQLNLNPSTNNEIKLDIFMDK